MSGFILTHAAKADGCNAVFVDRWGRSHGMKNIEAARQCARSNGAFGFWRLKGLKQ